VEGGSIGVILVSMVWFLWGGGALDGWGFATCLLGGVGEWCGLHDLSGVGVGCEACNGFHFHTYLHDQGRGCFHLHILAAVTGKCEAYAGLHSLYLMT